MTPPQVAKAYGRVRSALKSGRLVRQPCVDCGDPQGQAHHPRGYDSDHALDIEWVCRVHHLARHNRSTKPTWRREGIRRYMTRTRPNRNPWRPQIVEVSDLSSPDRLLQVLERLWNLFVTEEERAHAVALIERLSVSDQEEVA